MILSLPLLIHLHLKVLMQELYGLLEAALLVIRDILFSLSLLHMVQFVGIMVIKVLLISQMTLDVL